MIPLNLIVNTLFNYISFNYSIILSLSDSLTFHKKNINPLSSPFKTFKVDNYFISANTVVDCIAGLNRFLLLYILSSLTDHSFFTIQKKTTDKTPSLTLVYPSINWTEREIYDLFGIYFFSGIHSSDSRRILTDYKTRSYPLRKEHPVVGYTQSAYSYMRKGEIRFGILINI